MPLTIALVLTLAGCASAGSAGSATTAQPPAASGEATPASSMKSDLPQGFRWESFQDVQVAVPDGWGYGTSDSPWCLRKSEEKPYVGRPGAVALVGCGDPNESDGIDPATAMKTGGEFVWLSSEKKAPAKGISDPVVTGDRATVTAGTTTVAVQAEPALRARILATVQVITTDHNGCPVKAPFTGNPDWRPAGPAVTGITGVKSIAACSYSGALLASSLVVQGKQAVAALGSVADAPVGGGPNSPADECVPDDLVMMEQLVLQVDASGPAEIGVRYGGCFHRGIDDGITLRKLTRAAVQPFVGGPNRITSWQGEALGPIVAP
jgi:hypothetical protein